MTIDVLLSLNPAQNISIHIIRFLKRKRISPFVLVNQQELNKSSHWTHQEWPHLTMASNLTGVSHPTTLQECCHYSQVTVHVKKSSCHSLGSSVHCKVKSGTFHFGDTTCLSCWCGELFLPEAGLRNVWVSGTGDLVIIFLAVLTSALMWLKESLNLEFWRISSNNITSFNRWYCSNIHTKCFLCH